MTIIWRVVFVDLNSDIQPCIVAGLKPLSNLQRVTLQAGDLPGCVLQPEACAAIETDHISGTDGTV